MFFSKVGKSSVKITSDGVEAKMQAKGKHGNINQTITNGNGNTQIINHCKVDYLKDIPGVGNENTQIIDHCKEYALHLYDELGLLRVGFYFLDDSQYMSAYVKHSELESRDTNHWISAYNKSGQVLGTVNLRLVGYIKYLDSKGRD